MLRFITTYLEQWNMETASPEQKQLYAKRCGEIGIGLNLFLFLIKFFCGQMSGSVSIQADAINNLTDVAVAVITLAGVWVAGFGAGENHPFGHGRFEWLMGIFSSLVVIMFGGKLAAESVASIRQPSVLRLNGWIVTTLICAVGVKGIMYLYNHLIGEKIQSISMKATATDSLGDMVSTTAILVSVGIQSVTGLRLDGIAGLGVAIFIIFSGIQTMTEGVERILGQNGDVEKKQQIIEMANHYPAITGISELYIHDYGMGNGVVSMHIEGNDNGNKELLTMAAQEISYQIYEKYGWEATIQVDLVDDSKTTCDRIGTVTKAVFEKMQLNAYIKYLKVVPMERHTLLTMEIVCDHMEHIKESEIQKKVAEAVKKKNPGYEVMIKVIREVMTKTVRVGSR